MNKTILVVEDNALGMKLFCDLFRKKGYDVLMAVDGEQAIEVIRNNKPDLVVLDIQLPKLSGIDVVKVVKANKETKNIKIIAVTAHAMLGDKEKILESGCDEYVPKPISIIPFCDLVKSIIGE
jgi:two-component system cell cycle response regulator DivK